MAKIILGKEDVEEILRNNEDIVKAYISEEQGVEINIEDDDDFEFEDDDE